MTSVLTGPSLPDQARAAIPGGVNSAQRNGMGSERLVITAARGTTLTNYDGLELLDFQSCYGATILGHGDPDVDRAVKEAIDVVDNPGFGVTAKEIEFSEALIAAIDSVEKVSLVNTGSETTFYALRLARTVTGRQKVVKFEGAYHGYHDAVVMNTGTPVEKLGQKYPYSGGVLPGIVSETLIATWNDLASLEALFDSYPDEIAAVIVDPILSSAGGILPDADFIQGIRDLTTANGTIFVLDEMITGFRHSFNGFQSVLGVTPDITTLGKAIANGYPIAAVGGRADLMDAFSTHPEGDAYIGGTYNGHPAMAAAGIATLAKLSSEPVYDHIFRLGELARTGLREMYERIGVDVVIGGYGSIFHPWFLSGEVRSYTDVAERHDADLYVRYRAKLLDHGILETPLNLKSSKLNYAHTEADIERLIAATEICVKEVLAERATA